MPYTVGAEDFDVKRVVTLPGDPSVRREVRAPIPPLHAVQMEDRDAVHGDGTMPSTAVCGQPVLLFRVNWPEAAIPWERCERCDELAR